MRSLNYLQNKNKKIWGITAMQNKNISSFLLPFSIFMLSLITKKSK